MVQLNGEYYECLTPATTVQLLEVCRAGRPPTMGKWGSLPLNSQVSCEGPLGKMTLQDPAAVLDVNAGQFAAGEVAVRLSRG